MSDGSSELKLEPEPQQRDLVLLDDSPAGVDGPKSAAFSHELYAGLLRDALLSNHSGICFGFFARWGQGKSTVVNLLSNILGRKAKLVIFNAYQARGDSVRRQMLLSVLRQINPAQAKDFERFSQTITPLEFATAENQEHSSKRNILKLMFLEKKLDWFLVVAACAAFFCTSVFAFREFQVVSGNSTFAESYDLFVWLGGMIVACASFIARKFQERKTSLLAYTQPVSDSQRLKFPEQFASVFINSVQRFCKDSGKRLVVVVDDLDRCEPGTVVEALASVRQFCHGGTGSSIDCQFLIPCDEGQMVSALEADGYTLTASHTQYHNYSETEMLRKFFDVVVRMDEIVPESLADFAAEQAATIGISPELARDMVDAAAVREPRKIKSLLNALRVAQETVKRSQTLGLLPDSKQLERFDYTLAMLVCYQELAPKAFTTVRDNPDILLQQSLPIEVEPVAQRILSSFGAVSAMTADVLLTKQNEPSLRGLPQAHSLPVAFRADRIEEVVKLLSEANEEEQNRLLRWLCRKIIDARSGVRIKQILSYILDFGKAKGWISSALRGVPRVLDKKGQFIQAALRLGNRLETWGDYCDTLPKADRLHFDQIVLQNYLSSPDSAPDEEQFVLRFADKFEPADAQRLKSSFEATLFPSNTVNLNRLDQISSNLPHVKEIGCFGFAPRIGERLFKSLNDSRNPIGANYHDACLKVGLRFIGTDGDTANAILTDVLEKTIAFGSPQDLSESYLRSNGVYFELLRGLLASQSKFERFQAFFRSHYNSWIANQSHPHGRLKVILYIQPGWGFLSEQFLEVIAGPIASWFWDDEEYAKEAVATIDTPSRVDEPWLKGRDSLRRYIFKEFCQNYAARQSNLSSAGKRFLGVVGTTPWNVSEEAEKLLSDKVCSLNPNIGGRPNNIDEWFDLLKPLCNPDLQYLARTVRESLINNRNPRELVEFALRTVWSVSIPDDCAAPLAEALKENPEILENEGTSKALSTRSGFSEVARVLLNHIPGLGVEWMHDNRAFMSCLSEAVAANAKLSEKFQTVVDALLTATRADYFETGLQLIANHSKIDSGVKSSLIAWHKAKDESDPLAKRAVEISKRPEF